MALESQCPAGKAGESGQGYFSCVVFNCVVFNVSLGYMRNLGEKSESRKYGSD